MENKIKHDPENYHKMSEPFESKEAISTALTAFNDELSELRKKYKIADILVTIQDSIKYEDGNIGQVMLTLSFGNSLNIPVLAAYAHGQAQAESREHINKLLSGQKQTKLF